LTDFFFFSQAAKAWRENIFFLELLAEKFSHKLLAKRNEVVLI
jgi:hypothetical protein